MKKIIHVLLGLLAFIIMVPAYLLSKLFGIFVSEEEKRDKPWLENFIILYVTKCLTLDGDITDPVRLSQGDLDFGQRQSLLVYLKAYLHKIDETYEPSDFEKVVEAIPRVWAIHVGGFRSESAVRAWCMHQNPESSKDDVDTFVTIVKKIDKTSEEWVDLSRQLLEFRLDRVFKRKHSEGFMSYTETMLEDYMASTSNSV